MNAGSRILAASRRSAVRGTDAHTAATPADADDAKGSRAPAAPAAPSGTFPAEMPRRRTTAASAAAVSARRHRGIVPTSPRVLIASAAALIALALAPTAASAASPSATLETPTAETTRAQLSGSLDPADNETYYCFEVTTEAPAWPGFCYENSLPANSGPTPLTKELTGLKAGTEYTARLAAVNFIDSEVFSEEKTFTTDPAPVAPTATVDPATGVSYTTASISGVVDPEGGNEESGGAYVPIHWALELESATEAGVFSPVASGDITGADAESPDPVAVGPAALTELAPGHAYHYRLTATYAGQEVQSEAGQFTTTSVARPTITALAASEVTGTTAHLSAEIDPGGSGDPVFDTHYHFECVPDSNPAAPHCSGSLGGTLPAGPEAEVQTTAKELQPNTTYTLRLIATNAGGERKSTTTFSTPGAAPQIIPFDAGPISATTADINAEVDPGGASTSYYFEWGTEDCSTGSCASIPPDHEANAGSAPYFTDVSRRLTGLSPSTTYHFRIVARNSFGIAEGPDRSFTTPAPEPPCTNAGMPGTDFLPDCRAYEMVSPPDKHGADVIPQSFKTHVRPDGDAVTFSSLGGFAGLHGSSADFEYLAERTGKAATNGWSTHGINPPGGGAPSFTAVVAVNVPTFVNAFTPDLKSAVYRSWRPLTDAPNVAEVSNLYRIDGLDAASESAQLLSDSANPIPALWAEVLESFGVTLEYSLTKIHPSIAGASTDLSHVVFNSPLRLTADAPPYQGEFCELAGFECAPKLYENDNGTVRLVGRIPAPGETECDDVSGPPCEAAPSSDTAISAVEQQYSQYAISADGDRIYFQAPANGTQPGPLYLREDGERTYKLVDNGEFFGASADGSRAFFVTSEQLLPSDTDGSRDLYMWDRKDLESQPLTLISSGSAGSAGYLESVLGASADGSTVYFVIDGQLIAGGPPVGIMGLYRWHEGDLSYIGAFPGFGAASSNSSRKQWVAINSAKKSRISPDGRHLLFATTSAAGFTGRGGFTGYDHGHCSVTSGCYEFYLYDATSGRLRCASCNPSGEAAKSDALIAVRDNAILSQNTSDDAQAMTDDGRYVFFNTEEALVPRDTNGRLDAYEYDSRTEQVHLLSSGTSSSQSYVIDSSPDGRDAYIVTRERLSGWDTDNAYDLYDVRVDGGFAEPRPTPTPCAGDACRPPSSPAPAPSAKGSTAPTPGNPPRPCPKGKVKKNGKCVKKQKKKSKHNHQNTSKKRHTKKSGHKQGGGK